jgi:hypothetical protein
MPVRNPLEVASSLERRDGFCVEKSCAIWLRYCLDADFYTRCLPRVIICYSSVLDNWQLVAEKISERLGISWPTDRHSIENSISSFIKKGLRHHHIESNTVSSHPAILDLAKITYESLVSRANNGEGSDNWKGNIENVRESFNNLSNILNTLIVSDISVVQAKQEVQALYSINNQLASDVEMVSDRISKKKILIDKLNNDIEKFNKDIVSYQNELSKLKKTVKEKETIIGNLEHSVNEISRRFDLKYLENINLTRKINLVEKELIDIYTSKSWLLTRPLRTILRWLK